MKISNWKPSAREGARKGTFDLAMPSGISLIGCAVVEGQTGMFVSLPNRRGSNGKYYAVVVIEDKERKNTFDVAVLDALRKERCIA